MYNIKKMFEEVTTELWEIKRYQSSIAFKDLVDFYKQYNFSS